MTPISSEPEAATEPFRILSLDGGGAKGFYTIGVLREIEAMVGKPLYQCFDLIFGTSTGGIIAALLALGHSVDEVHGLYKEHVPTVMRQRGMRLRTAARKRSAALKQLAETVFGARTFSDVKTGIGIVATRWDLEKPMIFKGSVQQAHGRVATFTPGFGCTIAEAVRGSCSAYPFFEKTVLKTSNAGEVPVIDGGYCANNPTLYAIADAVVALKQTHPDLRVVSIGVGIYPEPKKWSTSILKRFVSVQLLQKTLDVNTASMEQLRSVLFKAVPTVRINETFERPEMATDLLEADLEKLNCLFQRGGESFAKHEADLKKVLAEAMASGS